MKAKKFLITGVSSGLGLALGKKLVQSGNFVWGIARRKNLLIDLANELGRSPKFISSSADIAATGFWKGLIREMASKNYTPDVVIFNAAILRNAMSGGFNTDVTREVFEINFFSVIKGVETLTTAYPKHEIHFILISSTSAFKGSPKEGIAYSASKAAASIAFESLYQKYKNTNFTFTTIFFGPVKTGMNPYKDKNFLVLSEKFAVDAIIKAFKEKQPSYYYPKILFFSLILFKALPPKINLGLSNFLEKIRQKLR